MKGCSAVVAACGLLIQAAAALDLVPSVTVVHNIDIAVRQKIDDIRVAAIVPTESGQIGVNPPGPAPTPANIEGHTKYLTVAGGTTKWIGSDPNNIAVATTTTKKKGGATAVATITQGVSAIKAADGGINVLLSPAVKKKLEAIAKQVKPCGKKRKRSMSKRGGPSCGLADFVQRVGADEELQANFAHPLTDQVYNIDEGYVGDPATDGGWEGNGGHHPVQDDEGYFSDDEEGFFEGAEGAEGTTAGDTVEAIVFSSEEEAAAIAAGLSGGEAAAAAGVWGGSTVTAGSFLAFLWSALKDGKDLSNANEIPKESIHKITKTKTKTKTTSSTTSSKCPAATAAPPSCDKCKPTSTTVKGNNPKATGFVDWACSEGSNKGCLCSPQVENRITYTDSKFAQAVLEAIKDLEQKPREPETQCPGDISPVSSKFVVDKTTKSFCEGVMKDLKTDVTSVAYDIDGNKIPLLKMVKVANEARSDLYKRSPPEKSDYYNDYKFFLSYKHDDGKCLLPKEDLCKNAFEKLVGTQCGSNHGSAGDRMYVNAVIDTGCGIFSWKVESPPKATPPPPKPTVSERKCHDAHKHHDVHASWVDTWSGMYCPKDENQKMKAGDKEIYWYPIAPLGGDSYQNYKISWIEGCTTTTEQSVAVPVEGAKCGDLLRDNYYKCKCMMSELRERFTDCV
ncbi:hypothetical protein GQ44DRAFT_744569 [Phaeosphaeriaceae sp. PMI808]|nr:hypothetical protein GQ44DRAFT_744569 [Phaeosphaeriaceae sp. PMI808]